jgi:hypothetical protein
MGQIILPHSTVSSQAGNSTVERVDIVGMLNIGSSATYLNSTDAKIFSATANASLPSSSIDSAASNHNKGY